MFNWTSTLKTLALTAIGLAICAPALADPLPLSGESMKMEGAFCHSLDAARQFMTTYKGDPQGTVDAINAKTPHTCGIDVLFGKVIGKYDTMTNGDGTWRFVKIEVLAVFERHGPLMMVVPLHGVTYTAFQEAETAKPETVTCDPRDCI